MSPVSRRTFLQTTSAAIAAGAVAAHLPSLHAEPLNLPLGLQLYSVRDLLTKDYEGTLKQVAALGYREVESAGYYGRSADQAKQAFTLAGLRCVSAHYSLSQLQGKVDEVLAFSKVLGVKYIICSSPMLKDPSGSKDFKQVADTITLDDWRWNAEQFDSIGKKVRAAGMKFGYHNHTMEFRAEKGVMPFDEILRLTDPKNVMIEMDCGWVAVAGQDPAELLKRYPTRIEMLHIKDFKISGPASVTNAPPCMELGRGTIDYNKIFAAAKQAKAGITHYFVEQEAFNMAPMESLKVDADYLRSLKV
jgi:sugar phosphate isomerase/epimerase